jgi:hypothetical protein
MSPPLLRLAKLLLATVAATALIGCGGSEESLDLGSATPSAMVISQGELASIVEQTSAYQRDLLADGLLTFPEYEGAIFEAVRCEEAAGFVILAYPESGKPGRPGPELTARGEYQYVQSAPETADRSILGPALQKCENEYVDIVRRLWAQHTAPSIQEMQQARDAIAECLAAHSVPAPVHPSGQELMRIAFPPSGIPDKPKPAEPYLGCAMAAAESFGLPGYIGQ